MGAYKNITKRILIENRVKGLLEKYGNTLYHEGINERMYPDIEEAILNSQHSLAECGIFPQSEIPFDITLIGDRFKDVVLNGREAFDVNHVDPNDMYMHMGHLFEETLEMEKPNKKALEELAVKMMMEEFEIPEDAIKFEAELTTEIDAPKKSNKQIEETIFEDHDELAKGNNEIKKRRAINALMAGASNNLEHLYHFNRNELKNMNTKLLNNYKKILAANDFLSYVEPKNDDLVEAGSCNVVYERKNDKITPTVHAKAMAFPILIGELYRGIMEVLSTHGIPKNTKLLEYAMNNADYDGAKVWDERIGPKMWDKFCGEIPRKDLNLKHLVFAKFISKPAVEFLSDLREVLGKTKHGKNVILEILSEVKQDIELDEQIKEMNDTHFELEDFE